MKKLLGFLLITGIVSTGVQAIHAQSRREGIWQDVPGLERYLDSVFTKEMERSKIPGAVISIVKDGKILFTKGYGYSNLENKTPVIPGKTIFRIGSITKVFTATSVMQLWEKGKFKMDDDVNRYLTEFKIPETYPSPVTFYHLLTHSSGFDEISKGRMVESERELVPLPVFLKNRLVRNFSPGEISSYNTYGITLAGYVVEKLSGLPLKDYFRKNIFNHLGMNSTSLGTLPEDQLPNLATGYVYSKNSGYTPLKFVWFNTYPASDINSTATDMAHFMIAHLHNGKYLDHRILEKKTEKMMLTQQHTNHPIVPGWTFGFQESRKLNNQSGLEHGGSMDDGFSSLLFIMPEHDFGIFTAVNKESTNLHDLIKEGLIRRFFPLKDKTAIATGSPELRKNLERFAGSYRWVPYCHSCKDSSAFNAQSFKMTVTDDGQLSFFAGKWVQVKPLVFQLTDGVLAGQVNVAFREDREGRITHFFLGGPFTYEKFSPEKK